MKKYYFMMAAVSAMMLTACSSEDDVLQTGPQKVVENSAVGFDVYTPATTNATRAGRTNVMTTTTLQKTGFGLFGYQTDNVGYVAGVALPNYMWNQQVFFNEKAAGWYYSPLKYWPNETKNDSQTTPTNPASMPDQTDPAYIDRLTFFAYAPWVTADAATGIASAITNSPVEAPTATAIHTLTAQDGKNTVYPKTVSNPTIYYKVATDPNQSVDLLWGVAPAGGLSYTSVASGVTETGTVKEGVVSIKEGMPLINLIKPAVNTNLKFMFQHALARLGVKVVAAVDQVAAGGIFDYGNSKITIEKIEIKGKFGMDGVIDLNNTTANVSKWIWKNSDDQGVTGELVIEKDKGLAPHLVFDKTKFEATPKGQQEVTGVTTTLADAIKVSSTYDPNYPEEYGKVETKPAYSPTTPYFDGTDADKTLTNVRGANYTSTYYEKYKAWEKESGKKYWHKYVTNQGLSFTDITEVINTQYPTATVWENICSSTASDLHQIATDERTTYKDWKAFRKVGNTYTETGRAPEEGDYIFKTGDKTYLPEEEDAPEATTNYYLAKPNYFMIIPNQAMPEADEEDRTLKVKITYYVSTNDKNVTDEVVYTKNEVEKDIVLPHLKNGVAYNLKLILGLTSVKVEAEVADWVTSEGVVNLPQNTSE